MKRLLLIVLVSSFFTTGYAQDTRSERATNTTGQQTSTTVRQENVPQKVQATLKQNFANARNVRWNKHQNYYEATFTQENKNYSVAITPYGDWVQTSISGTMNELPAEVREQFQGSEYASYEVRNVREVQTSGPERVYMVEVISTQPDQADPVYLYYEPTGNLYRIGHNQFVMGSPAMRVREVNEVRREDLPPLVENAFADIHPDVKTVRWRQDKNRYVAEYSEDGKRMHFVASPEGEWVESVAQYNFNQLPKPVQDAYNNAQYKDWEVYDVEYVSPPRSEDNTNAKFRIHMFKMNTDNNYAYKSLTYDANGNLLNVDQ